MNTTTKVILAIVAVLGVGALVYFLTKPKETPKPTVNTGSGNSLNIDLGSVMGGNAGITGGNYVNGEGEQVINGMTATQYLAAGYSQSEVNQIFA